jgi:hypothetical protein
MEGETVSYAMVIALSAAVVVGLVMLLIGARLARVACALMGLVMGAAGGVAAAAVLGSSQWATLAIIAIGGVIGALVATVLFRVWAAVSAGVVMGVSAAMIGAWMIQPEVITLTIDGEPAATPLVEGDEPDLFDEGVPDERATRERLREAAGGVIDRVEGEARQRVGGVLDRATEAIRERVGGVGDIEAGATSADADGLPQATDDPDAAADREGDAEGDGLTIDPAAVGADLLTAVDAMKDAALAEVASTWGELDGQSKGVAIGAGTIAGGTALVLGVVLPVAMVTVAAAWLGGWVVVLAGGVLLVLLWPAGEAYLPGGQLAWVAMVGLITVLGVGLQWTVLRRKSDD